ncbi:MAG: arginase family protein [Dokdonella sp.]|uniref:arginase family protein n=1 Tax=Dokdonella sp. TaxID=2291710 RepID=UPI0032654842
MNTPVVLDFDRSVGPLPDARVIDLGRWQESIRFGCSRRDLRSVAREVERQLPARPGTVFLGSGDYHHLTWPLVARRGADGPFEVIVFDNHPDNMRFPFGVHCGSWVRRVAALPFVKHVHVVGIGSSDVGAGHAWENHLLPLILGKLSYWTIGVDTRWAARVGIGRSFRAFDSPEALLDRFVESRRGSTSSVYLSIDKDVLSADVARTNWDQGRMTDRHLFTAIDALAGNVIGSDVTGDVSAYRYTTWWKRKLSALDEQPEIDPGQLATWQTQHHALNLRLLDHICAVTASTA